MDAYIYQAGLFCPNCTKEIKKTLTCPGDPNDEWTFDSDDYPKGPFADGGGEADTPNHCAKCQCFLENPLTEEGYRHIERQIGIMVGYNEVVKLWCNHYGFKISHD